MSAIDSSVCGMTCCSFRQTYFPRFGLGRQRRMALGMLVSVSVCGSVHTCAFVFMLILSDWPPAYASDPSASLCVSGVHSSPAPCHISPLEEDWGGCNIIPSGSDGMSELSDRIHLSKECSAQRCCFSIYSFQSLLFVSYLWTASWT